MYLNRGSDAVFVGNFVVFERSNVVTLLCAPSVPTSVHSAHCVILCTLVIFVFLVQDKICIRKLCTLTDQYLALLLES